MLPDLARRLAEDGPVGLNAASERLGEILRAVVHTEQEAAASDLDLATAQQRLNERLQELRRRPGHVSRKAAAAVCLTNEIKALDWLADSYERDIKLLERDEAESDEARRWNRTPRPDADLEGRLDDEARAEQISRMNSRSSRANAEHMARLSSIARLREKACELDRPLPHKLSRKIMLDDRPPAEIRNALLRARDYYREQADQLRRELGDRFLDASPAQRDNTLGIRLTRWKKSGAIPADFTWRSSRKSAPGARHCEDCERVLTETRSDTRYCSAACKQRAYRERSRSNKRR